MRKLFEIINNDDNSINAVPTNLPKCYKTEVIHRITRKKKNNKKKR